MEGADCCNIATHVAQPLHGCNSDKIIIVYGCWCCESETFYIGVAPTIRLFQWSKTLKGSQLLERAGGIQCNQRPDKMHEAAHGVFQIVKYETLFLITQTDGKIEMSSIRAKGINGFNVIC